MGIARTYFEHQLVNGLLGIVLDTLVLLEETALPQVIKGLLRNSVQFEVTQQLSAAFNSEFVSAAKDIRHENVHSLLVIDLCEAVFTH